MRGIQSKIDYGRLQDLVQDYDFVGLAETRSNLFDVGAFPGHQVYYGNSGNLLKGHYGLALLVNKTIKTCFEERDIGLWAKCDLGNSKLAVGVCYIPHENSKYWNSEIFINLATELSHLLCYTDNVLLMGDFNARTGTMCDYVDFTHLASSDLTPPRNNKDARINTNGRQLVDLCKTTDLLIANGRLGTDAERGDFTCTTYNGASTVDYFLLSACLFNRATDISVLDFDRCTSDVHHPITCTLSTNYSIVERHHTVPSPPTLSRHWSRSTEISYTTNFDPQQLDALNTIILRALISEENLDTNAIYNDVNDIIINAAKRAGALKLTTRRPHQSWFDKECKEQKRLYRRLWHEACKTNDKEKKNRAHGAYKHFIRKKKRSFQSRTNNELLTLRGKDSKAYWSLLKKNGNNTPKDSTPSADSFYEHFKALNEEVTYTDNNTLPQTSHSNEFINGDFTAQEVAKVVKGLTNGKACGDDDIYPEFIKCAPPRFLDVLCNLFNLVLKTGVIPDQWALSIITPIFKKGSTSDPNNYRGISLSSILCKVFTSLINHRLSSFLEATGSIGNEQAGFRENFSCNEHIFVLHTLMSIYLRSNRRLYCTFVDYEKAFDTINRYHLWRKLLASGINGRILTAIKNMYDKSKAQVRVRGKLSESFSSKRGVRQGDNLSPLLFAIFINDFESHIRRTCDGARFAANIINETLSNEDTDTFLCLFALLYADDTILLADTERDMQRAIDATGSYCQDYGLRVNIAKTKWMVVSKGKVRKVQTFTFEGKVIDRVDRFCYLGVIFQYNGRYQASIKYNVDRARKALFLLNKLSMKLNLNVSTRFHLFDHMISPILLYGCEVWGFENLDQIELFHRAFIRRTLNVHKRAPSPMVYGESGRSEMKYTVWKRMITFWFKVSAASSKFSYTFYKTIQKSPSLTSPWLNFIKSLFDNSGIPQVFRYENMYNKNEVTTYLKSYYTDLAHQTWWSSVTSNSLCATYKTFKTTLKLERYLEILPVKIRNLLAKFRCAPTVLPIVRTRYGLQDSDRCPLCLTSCRCDEYHLILACDYFAHARGDFLPSYFCDNPSLPKFANLMNSSKKPLLSQLASLSGLILSCLNDTLT